MLTGTPGKLGTSIMVSLTDQISIICDKGSADPALGRRNAWNDHLKLLLVLVFYALTICTGI